MANAKTVKRVVAHPKYYSRIDGKLVKVPVGATIDVNEGMVKRSAKKFADPSARMTVVNNKLVPENSKADEGKKLKDAEERATKAETALGELAQAKAALEKQLAEIQKQ